MEFNSASFSVVSFFALFCRVARGPPKSKDRSVCALTVAVRVLTLLSKQIVHDRKNLEVPIVLRTPCQYSKSSGYRRKAP